MPLLEYSLGAHAAGSPNASSHTRSDNITFEVENNCRYLSAGGLKKRRHIILQTYARLNSLRAVVGEHA